VSTSHGRRPTTHGQDFVQRSSPKISSEEKKERTRRRATVGSTRKSEQYWNSADQLSDGKGNESILGRLGKLLLGDDSKSDSGGLQRSKSGISKVQGG
jgi:hypothetical protein